MTALPRIRVVVRGAVEAGPPCLDCAACCVGLDVELVPGMDDVPDPMVEWREEEGGIAVPYMMRRATGECIALTVDGRCSIYETRPSECRAFERGSSDCEAARERVDRPGIVQGDDVGVRAS